MYRLSLSSSTVYVYINVYFRPRARILARSFSACACTYIVVVSTCAQKLLRKGSAKTARRQGGAALTTLQCRFDVESVTSRPTPNSPNNTSEFVKSILKCYFPKYNEYRSRQSCSTCVLTRARTILTIMISPRRYRFDLSPVPSILCYNINDATRVYCALSYIE